MYAAIPASFDERENTAVKKFEKKSRSPPTVRFYGQAALGSEA
jgi:hypothetical protein